MNKVDLQLEFQKLQKLTRKLLKRMDEFQLHLEKYNGNVHQKYELIVPNKGVQVPVIFPVIPTKNVPTCEKCGISLDKPLGYQCPFIGCPTGFGVPWNNSDKIID